MKVKCHSKKNPLPELLRLKAFSLIETTTALIILALVSSSVLVVIGRCVTSTADTTLRMQAFEVARENMEILLAADTVTEKTEYEISERYPDIQWNTTIETFNEPVTSKTWLRAVCSAEYIDAEGQTQTVELTHWLTNLTEQQAKQVQQQKQLEEQRLRDLGLDDQDETITEPKPEDEIITESEFEDYLEDLFKDMDPEVRKIIEPILRSM